MYFVWEEDRDYAFMAALDDANPGHDMKWMMGRLMEPEDAPANLRLTVDEIPDTYPDFFWVNPAIFGSQRLRDSLTAAGVDNMEYYPVEVVEEETGKKIEGYFAMNVIGRIECIDRGNSKLSEWRKRVARIQSLALNESAIGGLKVFRMHEYPTVVVVAEDVADVLRGLPGVALRPANGWSDAHRF